MSDFTKIKTAAGTLFRCETNDARHLTVNLTGILGDAELDDSGTEIFESCILNRDLTIDDQTKPNTEPMLAIEVGDRITFRSVTRHSNKDATRIVKGFDLAGRPLVRFEGWAEFVVRKHEIIEVIKNETVA